MSLYEVTQFPAVEADERQRKAANDLLRRSMESARAHGWFDYARGLADGYELMFADSEHYVNKAFVRDDRILDPERPEFLMYYETERGPKLAGFMFLSRRPEEHGPQVGGPLTVWHYHLWPRSVCLEGGLYPVGRPAPDGKCSVGSPGRRSPEMLHVWFVDHPRGTFATSMRLPPDLIAGLATQPEAGADRREGTTGAGAWEPPAGMRFKTNWDGTALDRKTGLTWEVKDAGSGCARCADDQFTWTTSTLNPDGTAFTVLLDRLNNTCNGDGAVRCLVDGDCTKLGSGLCGLGGFHDWRLPSLPELADLLLEGGSCGGSPCVDRSLPGATRAGSYWSASADPINVTTAGFVRFNDGFVGSAAKTLQAHVRAVRGFTSEKRLASPSESRHHH